MRSVTMRLGCSHRQKRHLEESGKVDCSGDSDRLGSIRIADQSRREIARSPQAEQQNAPIVSRLSFRRLFIQRCDQTLRRN